ncbi:hypothetical protein NM688_g9329 [Phlebia brevispora]|uniref:Uncharacterized protein n=1 Tax=Phlebia brevispora TaxID=194682 RepID=A0ACC1RGV4_9APHY|nr:hypothetical protein NM688_g9329 [Phlebia brevispora]
MASNTSTSELSKLTVPQLKVLCKERKLTGYSKLGKNALLLKLADSGAVPAAQVQPSASAKHAHISSVQALYAGVNLAKRQGPHSESENHLNSGTSHAISPPPPLIPGSRSLEASTRDNNNHVVNAAARKNADKSTLTGSIAVASSTSSTSPAVATTKTAKSRSSGHDTKNVPPLTPQSSLSVSGSSVPTLEKASICVLPAQKVLTCMPPPDDISVLKSATSKPTKRASESTLEKLPAKKAKRHNDGVSVKSSVLQVVRQPSQVHDHRASAGPTPIIATIPKVPELPRDHLVKPSATSISGVSAARKRFKPLVVNKKLPISPIATARLSQVSGAATVSAASAVPFYLDLPSTSSEPSLSLIAFPPSITQRKRVLQWAVILSGLDDEDRRQCVFVSKLFRYAVYLSAGHILQRDFGGNRLDTIFRTHSRAMTNFWPYLRLRRAEAASKRNAYTQSFIPRALQGQPIPICRRLWGCPDNEKQIVIALRFLNCSKAIKPIGSLCVLPRFIMTRLWFALSIGGEGSDSWQQEIVVDVQEIIRGETWSIKLQTNTNQCKTVYVLEATCEVVGHPPAPARPGLASQGSKEKSPVLRADWSAYISKHVSPAQGAYTTASTAILEHLKWENHEEYDKGISKLWSRNIICDTLGEAKRAVAMRYILAVSGQWKTATEMAQDFAGLPSRQLRASLVKVDGVQRDPPVNLYLPAHHHVESVHLVAPHGSLRPMHPALAVVQTTARAYFVLRDNGMQVGCEEDGVSPLWMEVLRCDEKGLQLT